MEQFTPLREVEKLRGNFSDVFIQRSRNTILADIQIQQSQRLLNYISSYDEAEDPTSTNPHFLDVSTDYNIDNDELMNAIKNLKVEVPYDGETRELILSDIMSDLKDNSLDEDYALALKDTLSRLYTNALIDQQNGIRTKLNIQAVNNFIDKTIEAKANGLSSSNYELADAAFNSVIAEFKHKLFSESDEVLRDNYDYMINLLEFDKAQVKNAVITMNPEMIITNPNQTLDMIREICPLQTKAQVVVNTESEVAVAGVYNYYSPLQLLIMNTWSVITDIIDGVVAFTDSLIASLKRFNLSKFLDALESFFQVLVNSVKFVVDRIISAVSTLSSNSFLVLKEIVGAPRLAPFYIDSGEFTIGDKNNSGKVLITSNNQTTDSWQYHPFRDLIDVQRYFDLSKGNIDKVTWLYELNHSVIYFNIKERDDINNKVIVEYLIIPKLGTMPKFFADPLSDKIYMDGWFSPERIKKPENIISSNSIFQNLLIDDWNSLDEFDETGQVNQVFRQSIIASTLELLGAVPQLKNGAIQPRCWLEFISEDSMPHNYFLEMPYENWREYYFDDSQIGVYLKIDLTPYGSDSYETKTVSLQNLYSHLRDKVNYLTVPEKVEFNVLKQKPGVIKMYNVINKFSGVKLPSSPLTEMRYGEFAVNQQAEDCYSPFDLFKNGELPSFFGPPDAETNIAPDLSDYLIEILSTDRFSYINNIALLFAGNIDRLNSMYTGYCTPDFNVMLPSVPYSPAFRLLTDSEKINKAMSDLKPLIAVLGVLAAGITIALHHKSISRLINQISISTVQAGSKWVKKYISTRRMRLIKTNTESTLKEIESIKETFSDNNSSVMNSFTSLFGLLNNQQTLLNKQENTLNDIKVVMTPKPRR